MYARILKDGRHLYVKGDTLSPARRFNPDEKPAGGDLCKEFTLANNIHCICSSFHYRENAQLPKMMIEGNYFVIRIDEISTPVNSLDPLKTHDGAGGQKKYSLLLLTSPGDFIMLPPSNSKLKKIELYIPRKWFLENLNNDYSDELLKKYIRYQFGRTPLNSHGASFGNYLMHIGRAARRKVADHCYIQKKVNALLADFFSKMAPSLDDFQESERVKISKEEVSRLMEVRKKLDTPYPAPTFAALTKIALMSATSLKTKFKKMYGASIFEYFQSLRMQRARILLLTHKYSVKQIGQQLGYANLSNFTIAFKKEFNRFPHQLIK
jgi:AraC-like DNA-binding protein